MKDISLYNVMNSLSMTINLISTVAKDHHEAVTYLAYKISDNLNIDKANKQKLIFSSLIHDIGILYIEEDVDHKLHSYEEDIKHAVLGYHLIEKNFPVDDIPKIIKFHHHRWNDLPDEKLYMLSNILNLADELSYQISKYEKNILYYKDEIVDELLNSVIEDLPYEDGDEVALMVNGMGGTPLMELFLANRRANQLLAEKGIKIYKTFVGEYMTSLEMAGVSLTLLKLDDELKELLDAPTDINIMK